VGAGGIQSPQQVDHPASCRKVADERGANRHSVARFEHAVLFRRGIRQSFYHKVPAPPVLHTRDTYLNYISEDIRKGMKIPKRLQPLVDDGLVDDVLRSLKSGKEADVFVVRCGNEIRCAKVYKDATKRNFHNNAQYQEGRNVRGSRRARAMEKGSRYGRKEMETAWLSSEVDALFKLAAAGVSVPQPFGFFEGVLLMELVTDEHGNAAPRLGDVEFSAETARELHGVMIYEIVQMLLAGLVHGDLSEYNVLLGPDGPVIIDLPQAVDAAGNNNAFSMLERDIGNMSNYFGQYAPELIDTDFAEEIWQLYEQGKLAEATELTGRVVRNEVAADIESLMKVIEDARREEEARVRRASGDDETEE
jgi:RIO kinase 1